MVDKMRHLVPIDFSEVLNAFEFVSVGDGFEHNAYICMSTGQVHWISDGIDPEDEGLPANPPDIEKSDDYVAIPHKRDLDLRNRLVFSFAETVMPDEYDRVRSIFRHKGAHQRFKDLLGSRGMLEKWYAFEEKMTEEALRAWCQEAGINLSNG